MAARKYILSFKQETMLEQLPLIDRTKIREQCTKVDLGLLLLINESDKKHVLFTHYFRN